MAPNELKHPCFDETARKTHARIHLPVAPHCNIQCNFCNRRFDCPNESRPGVTSALLTPEQAVDYLAQAVEIVPNLSVVGIAGPGDPFARPEATLETLRRVRALLPDVHLCVATNGLNLTPHVPELKALGVSHVTITINAIYPTIGAKITAWVRKNKHVYRGEEGAKELIVSQIEALSAVVDAGITAKVNTVVMTGINQDHVVDIAKAVKKRGAAIMNCIPVYPVPGARFESMMPPKAHVMKEIREEVAEHLPLMSHCARCRADAAGLLSCEAEPDVRKLLLAAAKGEAKGAAAPRPYVAVASREGLLVNQHLGEARAFWIFERNGNAFREVARRAAPAPGGGDSRWRDVADTLSDCRALLVSDLGERPRTLLEAAGLKVFVAEGVVESGLEAVYAGKEIRSPVRKAHGCGVSCSGNGMGCG